MEEKKAQKSLTVKIRPARIGEQGQDQAEQQETEKEPGECQADQTEQQETEKEPGECQAEPGKTGSPGAADGELEQTTILQPLTITRVLPRWDEFLQNNNLVPILTSNQIGMNQGTGETTARDEPQDSCQAEQGDDQPQPGAADQARMSQAEQGDDQPEPGAACQAECQAVTDPGAKQECQADQDSQTRPRDDQPRAEPQQQQPGCQAVCGL